MKHTSWLSGLAAAEVRAGGMGSHVVLLISPTGSTTRPVRLAQHRQDVGLVLRRIGAPAQPGGNDSRRTTLNGDACVMPGGEPVETEAISPAQEPVELHGTVALDARVRRPASGVLLDVGRHDVALEILGEVEDVVLDPQLLGDPARVLASATERAGVRAPPESLSVAPTTSWPCSTRSAAATEESTPPDMPQEHASSQVCHRFSGAAAQRHRDVGHHGERVVDVGVGRGRAKREPNRARRPGAGTPPWRPARGSAPARRWHRTNHRTRRLPLRPGRRAAPRVRSRAGTDGDGPGARAPRARPSAAPKVSPRAGRPPSGPAAPTLWPSSRRARSLPPAVPWPSPRRRPRPECRSAGRVLVPHRAAAAKRDRRADDEYPHAHRTTHLVRAERDQVGAGTRLCDLEVGCRLHGVGKDDGVGRSPPNGVHDRSHGLHDARLVVRRHDRDQHDAPKRATAPARRGPPPRPDRPEAPVRRLRAAQRRGTIPGLPGAPRRTPGPPRHRAGPGRPRPFRAPPGRLTRCHQR